MSGITIVTGLWNIKRDELSQGWSRSYEHYLNKFKQLLDTPNNLIIYGDDELKEIVFQHRTKSNTFFIERSQDWFKNEFYDKIQEIRQQENWLNQSGWLRESTQARLEFYNPLVMSKVFLLHDAKILDPFNSTHLYWLDGGITNTVHHGYFTHDRVVDKLNDNLDKISFICFPYQAENEIHGFTYGKLCEYAGGKVDKVGRGGFFGGPKEMISEFNNLYYELMKQTLNDGYMGTEESLFSILLYKYPQKFQYYLIESNGLVNKFFEDVKNDTHKVLSEEKEIPKNDYNISNTALYVITFNSPEQFETLIKSMLLYDEDFITKPKKFLLDNSTDLTTTEKYRELCVLNGFEHIKKENLGICGGRQFIAEHADKNKFDFYFFFEDDMFFYNGVDDVCRNGFNRKVKNLYLNSLKITKNNNFDFLKLSFTEFYGDNKTQWSWYNVPQSFREKHWTNNKTLPKQGLDPNAPKTVFTEIGSLNKIPFAKGEVYYCNWPQVVTKGGNKKMFLTETWAHPYEQTWMSYMFQETIKGNLNPGILLLTPTEHDRFIHYDSKLRKES